MVANNRNMERGALAALLEDASPDPSYVDPARFVGSTSLWIGPAGTHTPLHHDNSNILFCQLRGAKRMRLLSPLEDAPLQRARRPYYQDTPLEALEQRGARALTVEVRAGETLFLPVGWWHEVEALEPSVTLSFLNLRRPNRFDWYAPGGV